VALRCAPIIGQAGPACECNFIGVSLRLPMASGLPLYETVTSVRRRFLGSSRTSHRLPSVIMWDAECKETMARPEIYVLGPRMTNRGADGCALSRILKSRYGLVEVDNRTYSALLRKVTGREDRPLDF
jgi:hypothetical protein